MFPGPNIALYIRIMTDKKLSMFIKPELSNRLSLSNQVSKFFRIFCIKNRCPRRVKINRMEC
jgi:hypothetical protein